MLGKHQKQVGFHSVSRAEARQPVKGDQHTRRSLPAQLLAETPSPRRPEALKVRWFWRGGVGLVFVLRSPISTASTSCNGAWCMVHGTANYGCSRLSWPPTYLSCLWENFHPVCRDATHVHAHHLNTRRFIWSLFDRTLLCQSTPRYDARARKGMPREP